jgi:hypothetical protein
MTSTCPQGHTSTTDDFCDVCGEPINPPAAVRPAPAPAPPDPPSSSLNLDPPAPAPATPAAPPQVCPNCGDQNPADVLFCEQCGYDFTTGQLPAPPDPAPGPEWVAELWIDPDWFKAQEAAGTCATSGAPTVIALPGTKALIGRASRSRNIVPQIDCSSDGSVSHTHAELTHDHDRWYVEDLGSTNGTFVGMPGDPLPTTPLPPHQRHELEDGERIFIGAWCRIQIRKATDAEKAAS